MIQDKERLIHELRLLESLEEATLEKKTYYSQQEKLIYVVSEASNLGGIKIVSFDAIENDEHRYEHLNEAQSTYIDSIPTTQKLHWHEEKTY